MKKLILGLLFVMMGTSCAGFSADQKASLKKSQSDFEEFKKAWGAPKSTFASHLQEANGMTDPLTKRVLVQSILSDLKNKNESLDRVRKLQHEQNVNMNKSNTDVTKQIKTNTITHKSVKERQAASCESTSDDYQVNGDGTVTDKITGLMWKQCAEGLSGKNCGDGVPLFVNWNASMQHAKMLNNNGFSKYRDWRLPTSDELLSIVQKTCERPLINHKIFPATDASEYWSASPYAGNASNAQLVDFYFGMNGSTQKFYFHLVRLVRGGQ